MELLVYLLKSSLVLGIFLMVYQVFLRNETFFQFNRIFLLCGIFTAFLLPSINFTTENQNFEIQNYLGEMSLAMNTDFSQTTTNPVFFFSWTNLFFLIYFSGMLFFVVKSLFSIKKLLLLFRTSIKKSKRKIDYYETQEKISPFSIFGNIVYNPNLHSAEDLQNILKHEEIHIQKKHSWDILLCLLMRIILWFNPFAWVYYIKTIKNIEFQADAEACKMANSLKSYQYSLLRNSLPNYQHLPITNFYQSFLKSRIMMLQKEKSNRINILKMSLVLPLLAIFFIGFQMQAQEKIIEVEESIAMEKVDQVPIYPGCENLKTQEEQKECMTKKIQLVVAENFDSKKIAKDSTLTGVQRIIANFTIDENGKITNIRTKADSEFLSEEAKRVIGLIPEMKPGKYRGNNVRVLFNLPIIFNIE